MQPAPEVDARFRNDSPHPFAERFFWFAGIKFELTLFSSRDFWIGAGRAAVGTVNAIVHPIDTLTNLGGFVVNIFNFSENNSLVRTWNGLREAWNRSPSQLMGEVFWNSILGVATANAAATGVPRIPVGGQAMLNGGGALAGVGGIAIPIPVGQAVAAVGALGVLAPIAQMARPNNNNGGNRGDPNPGDITSIGDDLIERMGGEEMIAEIKDDVLGGGAGRRNPDLHYHPDTGDIYIPIPGGGYTRAEGWNVWEIIAAREGW